MQPYIPDGTLRSLPYAVGTSQSCVCNRILHSPIYTIGCCMIFYTQQDAKQSYLHKLPAVVMNATQPTRKKNILFTRTQTAPEDVVKFEITLAEKHKQCLTLLMCVMKKGQPTAAASGQEAVGLSGAGEWEVCEGRTPLCQGAGAVAETGRTTRRDHGTARCLELTTMCEQRNILLSVSGPLSDDRRHRGSTCLKSSSSGQPKGYIVLVLACSHSCSPVF